MNVTLPPDEKYIMQKYAVEVGNAKGLTTTVMTVMRGRMRAFSRLQIFIRIYLGNKDVQSITEIKRSKCVWLRA